MNVSAAVRFSLLLILTQPVGGLTTSLTAQTDPQWLTNRMTSWFGRTHRAAPGEWGVAIADQSGRLLWSMNPDRPLMPASTVKLFTTGFARTVLGGTARRATRVVGEGTLDSTTGAWVGSWALQLNGDPSLERAEGSGPTLYDLAVELQTHGIRKLTGPLQVQSLEGPANAVYPAAWSSTASGTNLRSASGPPHRARECRVGDGSAWDSIRPASPHHRDGARGHLVNGAR